jgi:hypothetical protein
MQLQAMPAPAHEYPQMNVPSARRNWRQSLGHVSGVEKHRQPPEQGLASGLPAVETPLPDVAPEATPPELGWVPEAALVEPLAPVVEAPVPVEVGRPDPPEVAPAAPDVPAATPPDVSVPDVVVCEEPVVLPPEVPPATVFPAQPPVTIATSNTAFFAITGFIETSLRLVEARKILRGRRGMKCVRDAYGRSPSPDRLLRLAGSGADARTILPSVNRGAKPTRDGWLAPRPWCRVDSTKPSMTSATPSGCSSALFRSPPN